MPWVDLHLHSAASADCKVPPEAVLRRCRLLGLSPVFLTDHDSIDGARSLIGRHTGGVVVGQEITTRDGDVIGLFLQQPVAPGQPAERTVREIRDQGGLVYLQHPYDRFRRPLSNECIRELARLIDIVEVYNARCDDEANRRAADLCEILGAAPGAGSDGHRLSEIGATYIVIEQFTGPSDFLSKLRRATIARRPNRGLMALRARFGANERGPRE